MFVTAPFWVSVKMKPALLYVWLQLAALPSQHVIKLLGVTESPLTSNVTVWAVVTGTVTVAELLPEVIVKGIVASTTPPELLAMTLPVSPAVLAAHTPPLSVLLQALTVTEEPVQVTPLPV